MITAIETAKEMGAEIHLADRDIRTTLSRTWRAMGLWSKIKLLFQLMLSIGEVEEIKEEDIEKMKNEDVLETLLAEAYTVTDKVDRMGMRLEGPVLAHRTPDLAQIASDGIVPGAVQVPGNGQPIVLLADGQTVGGYPKIATVISADLPRLARRSPKECVRFALVDVAEAERILRDQEKSLKSLAKQARPSTLSAGIDLHRLYEANLISGVVDIARPNHFPGSVE